MRKYLIRILIFICLVFLFDRIAGNYLDNKFEKNFKEYSQGHLNYFVKNVDCDTLFIGSSRMWHHINTNLMSQNSFNLSRPAMHIGYFTGVLNILKSKNKLPLKVLVLDIAPGDILESNQENIKKDIHQLRYYYDQNDFVKKEINKNEPFEFIKYFSRLYRHNGNVDLLLFNEIRKVGRKLPKRGFYPLRGNQQMNQSILDEENTSNDAIKFNTEYFSNQIDEIKLICDKNNIELICITSPYLNPIDKRLSEKMHSLLMKKEIRYVDFSQDEKWKNDKSIWHDELHLNEKGANLLTKEFLKKINPTTSP